jgi:hypothetical protein
MSVSSAELPSTTEAVELVEEDAAPSQVLISTAEVMFGTAAARTEPRDKTSGRFGGMWRRFFGTSIDESHPRPHDAPKRYAFLEDALMAREMGRL